MSEPKLSREDIALIEVGRTDIGGATARLLVTVFLVLIVAVPLVDAWVQWHRAPSGDGPRIAALGIVARPPAMADFTFPIHRQAQPDRNPLVEYEHAVERASPLRSAVQRTLQGAFIGAFGLGNNKVVVGRDGWLFYRPGVDYLAAPDFRSEAWSRIRPRRHGDPLPAFLALQRDCRAAGAELLLMPMPDKAQIAPEHLGRRLAAGAWPENPGYAAFRDELARAGIAVFDPAERLRALHRAAPAFLAQDTHWTPAAMTAVAQDLAERLRAAGFAGSQAWHTVAQRVARVGDLVDTLMLPAGQTRFAPVTVELEQVVDAAGTPWRTDRDAAVVLLGDSFCNIYTDPGMGWGESAGFAPQLARHLGTGIDAITINGQAASGVREALARRTLAGKRLVVWQFPVRDLAQEDWREVAIPAGQPEAADAGPAAAFFCPPAGTTATLSGVVQLATAAPQPGSVPYRDHVIEVVLGELAGVTAAPGTRVLLRVQSMRDQAWTAAARWRVGERVRVTLRDYEEVAERWDPVNTALLGTAGPADAPLCFAEPAP